MFKNHFHSLDADVIIIGAGVAGMTAAYNLIQKEPSLNVMVLEATDRVGGRTASKSLQTDQNETCSFDVGGQWISSQQKLLLDFLHNLHIKTETRNNTGANLADNDGKIHNIKSRNLIELCSIPAKLEFAKFNATIEKLCDNLPLEPDLATKSMRDFINGNIFFKSNKVLLESAILITCGVPVTEITVGFYIFLCISRHGFDNLIDFDKQLGNLYIKGGTQTICDRITAFLQQDILLVKNTKILKIIRHRHDIEVASDTGNFFARNLIIAIPPAAILEIHFTPSLPESKLRSLGHLVNGKLYKFVATYPIAFWREANLSGTIYIINGDPETNPLIFCYDNSVDDKAALSGYYTTNQNDIKDLILEQLADYFGVQALLPTDFVTQKWTGGSPMCCFQSFKDVQELEKSENTERIYWAGAETSIHWFGSIAGAVLSGKTASTHVLYDLRPAVLTVEDMMNLRRMNLSFIRRCNRNQNNIYKRARSTYYQISLVLAAALLVIIWRKFNITSRVKNQIFKRATTYQIV